MSGILSNTYHGNLEEVPQEDVEKRHIIVTEHKLLYHFYLHLHPYVGRLIRALVEGSVQDLQAKDTEYTKETLPNGKPKPLLYSEIFSQTLYNPSELVMQPYPVKDLDFSISGAYSVYNWELFYHIPLTVAIHLSRNQRFEDSQRWFHYIFDPTDNSQGSTPERFWKVKPFQTTDIKLIEEILINLASGKDPELQRDTIDSINAWKESPFRPHAVASYRQSAYMFKAVMAYLDNLIAWGDSLFRQDTRETINEATQLYVIAANILGPRPQAVPKKGSVRQQTYASLRSNMDNFSNVLKELETDIPFDIMPLPEAGSKDDQLVSLQNIGNSLYFCIPRNDKLLTYWDNVADRLYKIHNSLNIQGVFRQLALFEPPIDPALLARAAASGLDVSAILGGLNQPLPLVRFRLLIQRAEAFCQEVKSLGRDLLSAIEREDNEALTLVRAKQERILLEMIESVRYEQWQESIKSKEGLLKSLDLAKLRYTYYELQLAKKQDEIDKEFDKEIIQPRPIEVDIASGTLANIAAGLMEGKLLSSHEVNETLLLESAQLASDTANIFNIFSSSSHYIPDFEINVEPFGSGVSVKTGGTNTGSAIGALAGAARALADRLNFEAKRANRIDSFARREREWAFQSNIALGEIKQIQKQILAAEIRESIAEKEWKNHQKQIEHAKEIEQFLEGEAIRNLKKTTTVGFYAWMKREVKGLYGQHFQFAFDIAKKAERALQHEMGDPNLTYVQYGYLAGKEGLLAGEKLMLDIQRMEMAFHDLNQREYELTKNVSLQQLNPLMLLQLRATGRCTVQLPESLFDMDGPGQYFRRIKTVSLSIPCVTGPYASVNCKLTLLKSSIRKTPALTEGGAYAREDTEDNRFSDYFGSFQSVVTSSAQNDSGLFEVNLNDERYLPFENAGVISEWNLELPADPTQNDPAQFDYQTISDVILHIRYTAREGGSLLRKAALGSFKSAIEASVLAGQVRLFSIRHDFPNEWAKFKAQKSGVGEYCELSCNFRQEHYPFWSQGYLNTVESVDILARSSNLDSLEVSNVKEGTGKRDTLNKDTRLGNILVGKLSGGEEGIALPGNPIGQLTLFFNNNNLMDLWIALKWGG